MKKLLMIAAMAVAAFTANAQEIHITPHLGIGYSHFYNMPDGNNDANTFNVGADVEYMLGSKLGLSAGADLQYVLTEEYQFPYELKNKWQRNKFLYLNIPLLAQYHMGQFAIKAGLQPAFLLSAKHTYDGESSSVKDQLQTFSLALPVGVSYEFKKTPIVLDLRCAIPLTKQNKGNFYQSEEGSWVEGNEGNTKLLTVMLTAGYRF